MNTNILRALTLIFSIGINAARQSTLSSYLAGYRTVGSVVGLRLLNARTGATVADLVNGTVIKVIATPGTPPPMYKIKAVISGRAQSVLFVSRSGNLTRTKNYAPFEICKTASPCPRLGYGTHDLTVTPYRFVSRSGRPGKSTTIKFTIKQVIPTIPVEAPSKPQTRKTSRPTRAPRRIPVAVPLKAPIAPLQNAPIVLSQPNPAPAKDPSSPVQTNLNPPSQTVPLSPVPASIPAKIPIVKSPTTQPTRSPIIVPVHTPTTSIQKSVTNQPTLSPIPAPIIVPLNAPTSPILKLATTQPISPIQAPIVVPVNVPAVPIHKSTTNQPTLRPFQAPIVLPVNVPAVPMHKSTTTQPSLLPVAAPIPDSGIRLQLISTNTIPNKVVMELNWNVLNVVDLQKIGLPKAQFNINAVASQAVQSVIFSNGCVESSAPFAFCGNSGDIFYSCDNLVEGIDMNITVKGYSSKNLQGSSFNLQWTRLQILKGSAPSSAPTKSPVATATKFPTGVKTVAPTKAPSTFPVTYPITAPASHPAPAPGPIATAPSSTAICTIPELTTNTWWTTPSAPYPITVAEAQGSMIGRDFVIFSGFKNGYSMATTETYALDMSSPNAQWRRMDDMPFPLGLTHLGIAVNGMKAYLCGGYVGGSLGTHAGNCFVYDHSKPAGSGQQWTSFAPLPMGGRSGGGMIYDSTMNAIVYAAGSQRPIAGQNSAVDFTDTWMYSLSNPNAGWVSKTSIPFHGNHMNFVTAFDSTGKERHYFFGGQHADNEEAGNTATMYEYVVTTDKWIPRASMPFPRGHSAAASRAIGCGFIVAGGRTNTGLTNEVTYYDISTDSWGSIGTLPVEIHTNVCIVYDGTLRCETGWAEGTFSAQRTLK